LRDAIAASVAAELSQEPPADAGDFLNTIHQHVEPANLNTARLAAINAINDLPWARRAYYEMAKPWLNAIVGNELAMQRRLNLSIQLPGDASSLLAVHADSWDGDSPFEVVVWLPLVDCHKTKSMFLLPPDKAKAVEAEFAKFDGADTDDLFKAIEDDLTWIDIRYGQVLVFNLNLMHGNRPNLENETRWTMNCRFKSLFSPYAGKRLGEFFEPITLRAASRVGMTHNFPDGFDE
jgi:sporadic carbohydrate cluster 2OG-Fe(II) oxygenase